MKDQKYLKLYNNLRNDILKQVYPYGSKLKSKRTIALDNNVSVITVEHAMELLIDEGYIESREKSGYFVIYMESDFQGKPSTEKSDILVQQSNDDNTEEVFPYSIISKTIRKVLLDYNDKILVQSPSQGIEELRLELAKYLKRSKGIDVSKSQIIIGSGAEYLYGQIAQLFKDSIFALEDPSYKKIEEVYSVLGIVCEKLKLDNNGIATNELNNSKAKILHVTPFNSYPSGITIGISKKLEYLRWAEKRNGYIIEDNYDSELTISKKYEESTFSLSNGKNVIFMNTFSNTISPAIRIGYMILPEELLKEYNKKLGFYSCTVPTLDQYVLCELIKNGDFERHVNRVRRKRRKEQQK